VVCWHFVALAAFLVQTDPPTFALGVVILDPHGDDGANPSEGIGHYRDQRAVTQAHERRDVDAVEQLAGLFGGQHRGLAALNDMLGPAHGMGRVGGEHLADHEPVEQHADRRQVLLCGRLRVRGLQGLDISSDVDRLDIDELDNAVLFEPGEEIAGGAVIGQPRVFVADRGGEEFAIALSQGVVGCSPMLHPLDGCSSREDHKSATWDETPLAVATPMGREFRHGRK